MAALLFVIGLLAVVMGLTVVLAEAVLEESIALWITTFLLVSVGLVTLCGGLYLADQDSISRTICEQKGGTYSGSKCIKDGMIMGE